MLLLLKNVGTQFDKFYFVLSHSDKTSVSKIMSSGLPLLQRSSPIQWHTVHRSREVKQSWFTTIFTTTFACLQSFDLICRTQPLVIIANGPGTCIPLCYSVLLVKWIFFLFNRDYSPAIIFVESFCRVERLSMTGMLLYYVADRFIVQWPQLESKYPRARYLGDFAKSAK